MTLFWLLAAGLILLTYTLFWWSLHRRPRPEDSDSQLAAVIDAHRQRRQELEQELAEEKIDQDQFDQLVTDLDRDLLDLSNSASAPETIHPIQGLMPIFATLAVLPLVALSLYFAVGRPDLIGKAHAARSMASASTAPANNRQAMPPSLDEGLKKLKARLQADPDNVDDWVLLGRTYMATNQMEKALETFRHAMELAPANPEVKLFYAESLAHSHGNRLEGEPKKLIMTVLEQHPENTHALWLAGMTALQENKPGEVQRYWTQLLDQLPEGSEKRQQLVAMLNKLGITTSGGGSSSQQAQATAPSVAVRVTISLSPELNGRAKPDDPVYIFARAAKGPPMPLAIVRKQVKDLPISVTLDDTQAMMPQMKLSNFDQVVVGARVAKSGNAKGAPGDLEGWSQPLTTRETTTVKLVIDQIRS